MTSGVALPPGPLVNIRTLDLVTSQARISLQSIRPVFKQTRDSSLLEAHALIDQSAAAIYITCSELGRPGPESATGTDPVIWSSKSLAPSDRMWPGIAP